jgi:hypothetical protein
LPRALRLIGVSGEIAALVGAVSGTIPDIVAYTEPFPAFGVAPAANTRCK